LVHLVEAEQPAVTGFGERRQIFLVQVYGRPEVGVVFLRYPAYLVRLRSLGVTDAYLLKLVYLIMEIPICFFEVFDAATRRALEREVAMVMTEIHDRDTQIVALVLQLHGVCEGFFGNVLDVAVEQEPHDAGDQDRHQQPADRRDRNPPRLFANTPKPAHAASFLGTSPVPAANCRTTRLNSCMPCAS
jgi:hypothetical protein